MKLSGRSQYAQQVEACFGEIAIKYPALVAKRQRKGAPMLPGSGGLESVQCFYRIKEDGAEGDWKKLVPHLQGAISKYHYGVREEMLKDNSPPITVASIQACKARNSSAWLRPTPVSVTPISDKACRLSHHSRLGIPIYNKVTEYQCLCGRRFETGVHMLGCMALREGEIKNMHNRLMKILINFINRMGATAFDLEVDRRDYRSMVDVNKRSDIRAWIGQAHLLLDGTVTLPTAT